MTLKNTETQKEKVKISLVSKTS